MPAAEGWTSQIFQGNFQKGWLQLRRSIALAELMGYPQAQRAFRLHHPEVTSEDDPRAFKAQIWESLCALDRISGTILNLPVGTTRYSQTSAHPIVISGAGEVRLYLSKLADIAIRTKYVDDLYMMDSATHELYSTVLDLDRELRSLAQEAPKTWTLYAMNMKTVEPHHVVQYLHQYVTMRVHMPFTLNRDPGEEYLYSRMAGITACRAVAGAYHILRRALPSTFFMCRFLDLQALTAAVVLMLSAHTLPSSQRSTTHTDKAEIKVLVNQIVELMEEKSHLAVGLNFAHEGAVTIRALSDLLSEDEKSSGAQSLTLKVPLLGKIHVRRNVRTTQAPPPNAQPAPIPMDTNLWNQSMPQTSDPSLMASVPVSAAQGQSPWLLNPLSWSIEDDHEAAFQDALMADAFDGFNVAHMDPNFGFT